MLQSVLDIQVNASPCLLQRFALGIFLSSEWRPDLAVRVDAIAGKHWQLRMRDDPIAGILVCIDHTQQPLRLVLPDEDVAAVTAGHDVLVIRPEVSHRFQEGIVVNMPAEGVRNHRVFGQIPGVECVDLIAVIRHQQLAPIA